jgi:hypothetical protein
VLRETTRGSHADVCDRIVRSSQLASVVQLEERRCDMAEGPGSFPGGCIISTESLSLTGSHFSRRREDRLRQRSRICSSVAEQSADDRSTLVRFQTDAPIPRSKGGDGRRIGARAQCARPPPKSPPCERLRPGWCGSLPPRHVTHSFTATNAGEIGEEQPLSRDDKRVLRTCSTSRQCSELLTRRLWVRAPPGPPLPRTTSINGRARDS